MIQLEGIEIYYFRSIYTLKIKNLRDLCILSGKNDSGKSNVLKAINLFFNNETDWQTPLDFSKDFSRQRREEVKKETIKGRQFIRIKLNFIRGQRSQHSLPAKFYIMRTWYRDSRIPETKTSIEHQFNQGKTQTKSLSRAQAGLQRYLNQIRFEYIPAIKDRSFFTYLLGLLQDTILKKNSGESTIESSLKALNDAVEEGASLLNNEFEQVCGIKTDIRLPQELAVLFRAFSVNTKIGESDMPLTMRGDGIQTRFVASLLHYIATNSSLYYIWGFEEPENCLEHSLATKLADELQNTYGRTSQIFLTTHSPAFIGLEKENVSSFRIFMNQDSTQAFEIGQGDEDNTTTLLKDELGLLLLEKEYQVKFEQKMAELESRSKQVDKLQDEFQKAISPILLTEGKSDALILEHVWNRLFQGKSLFFRIISCDTFNDGTESAGGAGVLKKALESCRQDQPKTIGLFDRDEEGIKCFKGLDKNFIGSTENNIKIHKNKNAAAFLIPAVPDKEEYVRVENLPIEFLLPEVHITKRHNGRGLELRQEKEFRVIGSKKIDAGETAEPHYRKIVDNKVYFAEKVIPTLPDDAFENFKIIFENFKTIWKDLKK